jgi:hypothetical protein
MAFIGSKSESQIDFGELFAALARYCPGTTLLDNDYYATRIAKQVAHFRALGEPEDNPAVACTVAASKKLGQTQLIRVPLSGGVILEGTISQMGFLLATKDMLTSAALAPVLEAVRGFRDIEVEVGGAA